MQSPRSHVMLLISLTWVASVYGVDELRSTRKLPKTTSSLAAAAAAAGFSTTTEVEAGCSTTESKSSSDEDTTENSMANVRGVAFKSRFSSRARSSSRCPHSWFLRPRNARKNIFLSSVPLKVFLPTAESTAAAAAAAWARTTSSPTDRPTVCPCSTSYAGPKTGEPTDERRALDRSTCRKLRRRGWCCLSVRVLCSIPCLWCFFPSIHPSIHPPLPLTVCCRHAPLPSFIPVIVNSAATTSSHLPLFTPSRRDVCAKSQGKSRFRRIIRVSFFSPSPQNSLPSFTWLNIIIKEVVYAYCKNRKPAVEIIPRKRTG